MRTTATDTDWGWALALAVELDALAADLTSHIDAIGGGPRAAH